MVLFFRIKFSALLEENHSLDLNLKLQVLVLVLVV